MKRMHGTKARHERYECDQWQARCWHDEFDALTAQPTGERLTGYGSGTSERLTGVYACKTLPETK